MTDQLRPPVPRACADPWHRTSASTLPRCPECDMTWRAGCEWQIEVEALSSVLSALERLPDRPARERVIDYAISKSTPSSPEIGELRSLLDPSSPSRARELLSQLVAHVEGSGLAPDLGELLLELIAAWSDETKKLTAAAKKAGIL